MGLRQRIESEIYDEKASKVVDRQIIADKKIENPKQIDDLGYDHQEEISILQEIQDAFLFKYFLDHADKIVLNAVQE